MATRTSPLRRSLTNLVLDGAVFLAFLVATAPRLTGVAIHEWLSIAFAAAIVAHLLLHWQWIVGVTRTLLGRATRESRINYALNILLFVDVTVIIVTGLLISREVLPLLGLEASTDRAWRSIHHLASDAGVALIGLHLALHWRWIVSTAAKLLGRGRREIPAVAVAPVSVRREVRR